MYTPPDPKVPNPPDSDKEQTLEVEVVHVRDPHAKSRLRRAFELILRAGSRSRGDAHTQSRAKHDLTKETEKRDITNT